MGNYNKFASEYTELSRKIRSVGKNDSLYSLLGQIKGKKLLDVGCGAGTDAKVFLRMGARVWGVDISKKQIGIAKKEIEEGTFTVGDMVKLPFGNNLFDVVVSRYAIQASTNIKKSILEMIRVVRHGSSVIILTKHPTRTLLEGYINDKKLDYFKNGKVTSYLFDKKIKLAEPSHTLEEYFDEDILKRARLELFREGIDFPGSDRVIQRLTYPTYMVLKFKKVA